MKKEKYIAKLIFYISIIVIIGGIFIGIQSRNLLKSNFPHHNSNFSLTMFINGSIEGVVAGVLLIGLSEVIKLLQSINNSYKRINSDMQAIRSTGEDGK